MTWLGIRTDITPVADIPGTAEWAANVRLRKADEMQRRYGFLSTAIAKQAGAIRFIIAGNTTRGNFLTFDVDGGDVTGFATTGGADVFPPPPDGPKRRRPRGEGGVPQAPVINSVTALPASPQAYTAGMVVFTPSITYDGLSGPLIYTWNITGGPAAPNPSSSANPTWSTDFDGFCIPGDYFFSLTINTTVGGFSDFFPFTFTVS